MDGDMDATSFGGQIVSDTLESTYGEVAVCPYCQEPNEDAWDDLFRKSHGRPSVTTCPYCRRIITVSIGYKVYPGRRP
jgi:hypothetical protein